MSNPTVTEMSREEAIEKFGVSYTTMEVKKSGGFAGHNDQVTEALGGEDTLRQAAEIELPETVQLPLDVEIGSTIYALRIKRDENGSPIRLNKEGERTDDINCPVEWEQVTGEITGVAFIDKISPHSSAPQNKGLSHSIIWETEQGMSFQAPLSKNPQTYATQFVFSSAEDLKAFAENVHKSDNSLLKGLHGAFNSAVFFTPANDQVEPAPEVRENTRA